MKKQYKSHGIHTPESLEIVRIQIEQEFGKSSITTKIDIIRVLQPQAKTELVFIPGQSWPEENTEIEFLTINGIFWNTELSGVYEATNEDETSSIQLNFISARNSTALSLIPPKKIYPQHQKVNNHILTQLVESMTSDGESVELEIEEAKDLMKLALCTMTGNYPLNDEEEGN
jgi:DNA-binding XRE family transcriptional regulator